MWFQDSKPLDLRRPSNWSPQQTYSKKHKHNSSISKFKNLISDTNGAPEPQASYPTSAKFLQAPVRRGMSTDSGGWDVVDDLPLRWATDFVPLATPGSRLLNSHVMFFELRRDEINGSRGSSTLAIATKQNILLYETPKGERAFRFVKVGQSCLIHKILALVMMPKGILCALTTTHNNIRTTTSPRYSHALEKPIKRFSAIYRQRISWATIFLEGIS